MILFIIFLSTAPFLAAEWRGLKTNASSPNISPYSATLFSDGPEVILYDHIHFKGDSKRYSISATCTDVLDFNDRTSSIEVSSGCVRLWKDIHCTGRSVDIRAPGEPNIPRHDFNDEVTSISTCDFPCYQENVEIEMHLNGANDLADHAEKMKHMMREWFPFLQSQLYTPAYRPIPRVDVYFDDMEGVAYATGREIHISKKYVRDTRMEDTGVYIHELTHVIHQARECPGWIVEGTAEYLRRWFYEPKTTPTKPTDQELTNPYVGDWLLYYLTTVMKRPIFYMLTKACQEGSYRDHTLKDWTGKDEKEWWREMVNNNEFPWKRVR